MLWLIKVHRKTARYNMQWISPWPTTKVNAKTQLGHFGLETSKPSVIGFGECLKPIVSILSYPIVQHM